MFGFKIVHSALLALADEKLAAANQLSERLERELSYWRKRADEERERADRAQDALNLQNGLPEVTATGVSERSKREREAEDAFDKRQKEIAEIFADEIDAMGEIEKLELPEEMREAAAKFMSISDAKKAN